ncbi:hypothetical protein [Martelella soudanensis]|uniref:hypothetical protein n=1 Tax=unclassified Martelella TaxID=2629616 RepID=UPI0015DF2CF6|nr:MULTISPECIES: hypothetical protein [unclassified Martelella]
MGRNEVENQEQKNSRSEEERAAWNRYMRNFRRGFRKRGLTSLSTVITTEHSEFIERYGRDKECQSKREALMMIIEDVKARYDQERSV